MSTYPDHASYPGYPGYPGSTDPAARSGRHPVSVAHLVSGLVLLGAVVVWALYEAGLVGGDDVRWLLPVPWVLAGGAGLLATTLSARRRREAAAAPTAYGLDEAYADPWSAAEPDAGTHPGTDPGTDPEPDTTSTTTDTTTETESDTDPTEEIR